MQQKLPSEGSGPFLLERNGQACGVGLGPSGPPLCCPRCGHQPFCGPPSPCAHLEHQGLAAGFSITGKPPDPLTRLPWPDTSPPAYRGQQSAQRPPQARSLSDSRGGALLQAAVRRRSQSVGVGTRVEGQTEPADVGEEDEEGGKKEGSGDEERCRPLGLPFPPAGQSWDPDPDPGRELDLDLVGPASFSAAVRVLRAADGTVQRRLARVSTELAQTDTELLCERAHGQRLARQRQAVAERERSLSRQVDVAVTVIAALREQLNASESQLEQREREVITIHRFLEVAARQEKSGKVRIQRFIEDLLRRIALAERLLEFYQANGSGQQQQQPAGTGSQPASNSQSTGSRPSSSGLHDNRNGPSASGPCRRSCRSGAARERLAQSSRLFCRPELRDDIWNQKWRHEA